MFVGYLENIDYTRATKEADTIHIQGETFALDGLEKNLDAKLKAQGIAIIPADKVSAVESYVRNQVYAFDDMKSDVEDLRVYNVQVYPGTYSMVSGNGGRKKLTQYDDQRPYYKATVSGYIKKLTKYAGNSEDIYFKVQIMAKASHVNRN